MAKKVVPLAGPRRGKAPAVAGVIARSTHDHVENAWVSLILSSGDPVLVVEFKAEDYGEEAWARAVKHGRGLAERLKVAFRKKRG